MGRRVKDPTTAEEFFALKPGDIISEAASLGMGVKGLTYPICVPCPDKAKQGDTAEFTAQDIAKIVKSAFRTGNRMRDFNISSLCEICTLAELSNQQVAVLRRELDQ
jgi:hypothetical protein